MIYNFIALCFETLIKCDLKGQKTTNWCELPSKLEDCPNENGSKWQHNYDPKRVFSFQGPNIFIHHSLKSLHNFIRVVMYMAKTNQIEFQA